MDPRRLTLRGVTRFTGEITLDLDQLPQGLIAVAGGNGSGKTTILESMAPGPLFLELPSRPGNLQGRVNRRDAYLELVHDYKGRTWRHLVQVDPGTGSSGAKTEAYLWELAAGADLAPVGEPWVDGTWIPVEGFPTPGRVNDYTQALEGLGFPSRDVFLAGPFSVHTGAGNFLELPTAKRRDLFSTLLGLGDLQTLADRAGTARKPLDAALQELEALATALERDRQASTELDGQVVKFEVQVEARTALVATAQARARVAGDQAATARAERETLEAARQLVLTRRQELTTEIETSTTRIAELEPLIAADQVLEVSADVITVNAGRHQELTEQRAALLGDVRANHATLEAAGRELHQARQELERLVEARRRLAAESTALGLVAAELHTATTELEQYGGLAEHTAGEAKARQELASAKAQAVAADTRHREGQAKAPSLEAAQARVVRLERDAKLLDGVPCGGGTMVPYVQEDDRSYGDIEPEGVDCGACSFLTLARQAAGELPGARKDLEDAQDAAEDLGRLWVYAQEQRAKVAELEALVERFQAKGRAITALAGRVDQLQDRMARRPELDQELEDNHANSMELTRDRIPEIEARQAEAAKAKAQVETDGREIRTELDALAQAPGQLEGLTAALARLPDRRQALQELRGRLEASTAARLGLVVPPAPLEARQRLLELEDSHRDALHLEDVERTNLDQVRGLLGHAKGRRAELGDIGARASALEASTAVLARRRAGFRELERALGKTGVQVLEIDAAGPTVARMTNDLLAATFGGRFAVRLDTIRDGARGAVIETFDLVVLDGNRKARADDSTGGGRKAQARERLAADVSELSKGEKVLVDEALKLAIAMFHAQRTGDRVLTLWRDECDTGLDPANRRRYPAMLRRALELGGFHRLYFVSHDQDVQAQADAVIRVSEAGAITTEVR